jgi:endogenous inhibitor of DNA gyrase (YacG/DUF329 family)
MKCPVCGKEAEILERGGGRFFHCGRVVLLRKINDHYVIFETLPEKLPEKGCPICGRPMEKAGKFRWWSTGEEEGLERRLCNQKDHCVYVTEEWYQKNR